MANLICVTGTYVSSDYPSIRNVINMFYDPLNLKYINAAVSGHERKSSDVAEDATAEAGHQP